MVESRRDRGSFWRARQSAVPTGCLKLAQEQGDDDPRVLECSNTIRCILDSLAKFVYFSKYHESERNDSDDGTGGVHDVLNVSIDMAGIAKKGKPRSRRRKYG